MAAALAVVAACLGGPAWGAASEAGWSVLADPVFRPVAPDVNLPGIVLPWTLAEDGEGFLWCGGETGLMRWDGYRFRVYGGDGRADGLLDHDVHVVHRAVSGTLWVGTAAGGLARYEPAADRFVPLPLGGGADGALHVRDIEDDGEGGLWVATGAGLFHVDSAGREIAHRLPESDMRSVRRDRLGMIWAGSGRGLVRSEDGGASFFPVSLPLPGGGAAEVDTLLADGAGRLWVGTRGRGAYVASPGETVFRPVGIVGDGFGVITAMTEALPGRIWIATRGRGMVEIDAETLNTRAIRRDNAVPGSLPSDSITALYRDPSGLVWVATTRGLGTYAAGASGVSTLFGGGGRADRLSDENIWALTRLPNGDVLAGLESNGVDVIDPVGGHVAAIPALAGRSVLAVQAAPSGGVLAATLEGDILWVRDDPAHPGAAGHLARLDKLVVPGGPTGNLLYAMQVIDGTIWFGGVLDGVWQIAVAADASVEVLRHETAPLLTNATVRVIAPAPDGRIAIGTDNGVSLLDPKSGAVERIFPDAADPQALGGAHVSCFATDHRGRLWVGTDSTGIDVLVGRAADGKPLFRRLGTADGLPNPTVDSIQVDAAGRIWASTDGGPVEIDPQDFRVRALSRADGVAIDTYWGNVGTLTAEGDVLFGGFGGITMIRPGAVPPPLPVPPVMVTDIRIGAASLPTAAWRGAAPAPVVTVPPDRNSVAVEFSALDYAAPDRDRYRYRLDGFDPDWIETDAAHRVAAYTNLPPGRYRLLLDVARLNGAWTAPPTAVAILVLPAWYQTIWFHAAAAAGGLLLLFALVQLRTVFLRQRQRELERLVAQRTAELSMSRQQLETFAYVDGLTGLPNRRAFDDAFRRLVQAKGERPAGALLLVDLDGFKQVNDTHGHAIGDEVLVIAAGRLRTAVRDTDIVARLGGDEFAVLLSAAVDRAGCDLVCERIVAGIAAEMSARGTLLHIGVSVGAVRFPAGETSQEELYRCADKALYEAKNAGRGIWRWYRELAES